eukprot:TRINITY_DN36895_c0_g1_i1.p1 TRINITY_DN36895_c0_g1~~TRINITY_DN36895_c0_g1_i1.p1  ORF type:complete len:567 (+),score=49.87 TRINITY_DN36895_c0_g1_i1:32-1732(+)
MSRFSRCKTCFFLLALLLLIVINADYRRDFTITTTVVVSKDEPQTTPSQGFVKNNDSVAGVLSNASESQRTEIPSPSPSPAPVIAKLDNNLSISDTYFVGKLKSGWNMPEVARLKRKLSYLNIDSRQLTNAEFGSIIDNKPKISTTMQRMTQFPGSHAEAAFLRTATPVSPAPVGEQAAELARKLKYPDRWEGRMRPEFFILSPPKTGTTFLDGCLRHAMNGNPLKTVYPEMSMRWPSNRSASGEPITTKSPFELNRRLWLRRGFRRWDLPKEPWNYIQMGRHAGTIREYFARQRFPPVEPESSLWGIVDATPDQIMIPEAAVSAFLDLRGAPFKPRFLVIDRDPVDRAFSHFMLFTDLKKKYKRAPEPFSVFADRLDQQHARLVKIPICWELLHQPEAVVRSREKVFAALKSCMYEQDPLDDPQVYYLPFGFVALGLRYWAELFGADSFLLLRFTDLVKLDTPVKVMRVFEKAFPTLVRNPPPCHNDSDWVSNLCSGPQRVLETDLNCGQDSPYLHAQAWTKKSASLGYSIGEENRLEKYRNIGKRWQAVLQNMTADLGIGYYSL